MTNFSVLISAYRTENPEYLERALRSIWDDQKHKPNQIVLIKDGPLTKKLDKVIENWEIRLGRIFCTVSLEFNVGLGKSLNEGIKHCSNNLIARMDTDDISLPDRFIIQIKLFEEHPELDIIGSNISEFSADENSILTKRKVPQYHEDIVKISKIRNPFNHPSVMYKKNAVMAVGGPKNFTGFDDYFLWVRMIENGSKCANIPKILLKMRAGTNLISRRGGFSYLLLEYKFQTMLFKIGYISFFELVRNLLIRLPVRIIPIKLRVLIYKIFMRDN